MGKNWRIYLTIVATMLFVGYSASSVVATGLTCANFTETKHQDCLYILHQGLGHDEEQSLLQILWDQLYDYDAWQPDLNKTIDPHVALQSQPIDNSSFILFGKVTVFVFLNYIVFSLSKSSFIVKWLTAV